MKVRVAYYPLKQNYKIQYKKFFWWKTAGFYDSNIMGGVEFIPYCFYNLDDAIKGARDYRHEMTHKPSNKPTYFFVD